jgi:hypothetical protein
MLLLSSAASAATPAVAAFWASHSAAAALIAPLAIVVAHWLPSPIASRDLEIRKETLKR